MLGPKREEVTGGGGELHNEEFHNLYPSSNVIRVIKSRRGVARNAYKILVGKPERNTPRGRSRRG
jgi:hypothetical protein